MAFFTIPNIAIKGMSATVPKNTCSNFDLQGYTAPELKKLVDTLGIENRRVVLPDQCASDLCLEAATNLLKELNWNKNEIEALFFVSQTPDFTLPGSSMNLQHRLGLPDSCVTVDINQGCAGYVYGLSLITAFMSASGIKKGLLLVGDTITKLISPHDRSLIPLFSDCGTATALEYSPLAKAISFNTSSEGGDYEAIIVPEGGARKPFNANSFNYQSDETGVQRKGHHLVMKGLDVFNFSLKKVAPNVSGLLQGSSKTKEDIDYFVFHQANRLIIEAIGKKLGVEPAKIPLSLKDYGNTSGATIPLTIVSQLQGANKIKDATMLLAGFGVGLSLASAIVDFNGVVCPPLKEI